MTSFLGGLIPGLSKSLKPNTVSTFDPTQQELYGAYANAIQGKGGPLGDIFSYDPEALRNMYNQVYAQPAYQNFRENTIPSITGSFRGRNLQNSSYLGGALSKAGTDVQKGLDANLAQMLYSAQQDSLNRKRQGLSDILGMQTQAYQTSPIMQLLQALAGGAGQMLGKKFGGM